MLSEMMLFFVHVLLLLTPTSGFLQSIDTLATNRPLQSRDIVFHEVCRHESIAEYEEPEKTQDSDRQQFRAYREYTIYWSVNITGDRKIADTIAQRHGFVNNGLASYHQ